MTLSSRIAVLIAASGSAATIASAQPFVIGGSGATLQEAFFRSAASTNDFIDVDGDGQAGSLGSFFPDQLATQSDALGPFGPDIQWLFHYRLTGSGNGILELDTFGGSGVFDTRADGIDTDMDGDFSDEPGNSAFADDAIWNRLDLVTAGVLQGVGNDNHLSGAPFLPNTTTFRAEPVTSGTSGYHIDFAAADVPVSWFAIQPGTPRAIAAPSSSGYGANPRLAVNKDGSATDQTNLLRPLTNLNTNTNAPDANTVYETPISITPVAPIVNYGLGLEQIDMSDLRHANATGRRVNGENVMVVCRDSGSGTRNAFMNGIGLDPSFGAGENIGARTTSSVNDRLGPNFQPSNKGGSSRMDATTQNHRLAMGHTGAERGVSRGWLLDEDMDILAVRSDIKGGTQFVRPTQAAVIDGGPDGFNIVGPAALSHVGDPRNAPANIGGWGWDLNEVGPTPFVDGSNNPNPSPPNAGVAAYLNNITRSVANVIAEPTGDENDFMPGERLALQFLLVAAPDNVPQSPVVAADQPIPIVNNASQNAFLRSFSLGNPNAALNNAAYQSFNGDTAGRAPFRTTGVAYTDAAAPGGSATGDFYVDQNGNAVQYGSLLSMRNKIAGDFNGDGIRNAADAPNMIAAWRDRNGGPAWAGADAVIEILGDFDGDGNFTAQDIRYFADGLVLTGGDGSNGSGILDRAVGFTAVDDAFGGNFFGTTLATGASYESGDSRADIAGSGVQTPNFNPIGHDGTVDAADIDYICANFGDFMDLAQAANENGVIDLSADMNGDLMIDAEDVRVVVEDILDTEIGDVNLDGVVDDADLAIASGNLGSAGGWADGDVNCDGQITQADLDIINAFLCPADRNGDGDLDFFDVSDFLADFNAMDPSADINDDDSFDFFDVSGYLALFNAGC